VELSKRERNKTKIEREYVSGKMTTGKPKVSV
jgi:hypothetical protein